MTQRRSSCGRRLQRSSASSGGSIGAARPGTYVVKARRAAPRSSGDPAGTYADTSAMWTQARKPPFSSSTDSASSKSFAVSGSIVKERSSRRSTRSESSCSGAEYGSNSVRAPVWTRSPSSTAPMSLALPSTRSSRARPRPVRTTARSPGPASSSPLRSSTSGTPETKYGSPTTSLPRFAISTTARLVRLGGSGGSSRRIRRRRAGVRFRPGSMR